MDGPDYILDIASLQDAPSAAEQQAGDQDTARRWLGIQFECCGVYARIYRNRHGSAYTGYCPRCGRAVRIKIGAGGTSHRFFRAT